MTSIMMPTRKQLRKVYTGTASSVLTRQGVNALKLKHKPSNIAGMSKFSNVGIKVGNKSMAGKEDIYSTGTNLFVKSSKVGWLGPIPAPMFATAK